MASVKGPLFSLQAKGTLADTLIYRRAGSSHAVYPHFNPRQPNTAPQQNHHTLFSLLAARWNSFSTPEQAYWHLLGQSAALTDYNAYISYNLARLNRRVPDGLVAWWPSVVPLGDTLYDLTPNENHGAWLGPADHWSESIYGYVQHYHPPNGHVNCGDHPLFEFAADFTFAYRYRSLSNANQCALSKWTGMGAGSHWWIGSLTGNLKAGLYTNDPSTHIFDSGLPHASPAWRHVALVRQASTGHFYVDASDEDSRPVSPSVVGQNVAPLTIGDFNGVAGVWPFDGLLHDVRLYDRALSPGEIHQLAF